MFRSFSFDATLTLWFLSENKNKNNWITSKTIRHQYSAVQYSTAQHSAVQYSTAQYSTAQYSAVQYSTAQYSAVQYSTAQYSAV
jgi:hypothetical protein